MDSLYENIDNYNESQLIEELRNENQELKAKMEKYTVTLEKLQTDFDKLAVEYKKLEINYSSLLKTARAEIERKTQIISNLNHEKDLLVLSSIQNTGNVLNVRRNWCGSNANQNKGNETAGQGKKPEGNQPQKRSSSSSRKESSGTPTKDICKTVTTDNSRVDSKNEKSVERTSDAKENVMDGHKQALAKGASIRCRRKSMPASSFSNAIFSSDEEGEISSPAPELRQKEASSNEAWRNSDRNYVRDNRPPDYDNRNRNYEYNKFRGRDRFEGERHRYSPERFNHRSIRDFPRRFNREHRQFRESSGGYRSDKDGEHRFRRDGSGDQRYHKDQSGNRNPIRDGSRDGRPYRDSTGDYKPRREDSGNLKKPELRKRPLESPTREYQQKNHEEFERDYYDERNKYLEEPKYLSDYEEPSNKRLRTDSYHNSQDIRSQIGKGMDQVGQPAVGNILTDMSCQSPDYLSTELACIPKEIKLNADCEMDDPRERSNKYVIRTEKGEKVLSTMAGRNVDLKPVNKSLWKLMKVETPLALMKPPQSSEDRVNDIYGDIDFDGNTSDVSSAESGETMGSAMYDISTDPFHYEHRNDGRRKTKFGDLRNKSDVKNMSEKAVENSKSLEPEKAVDHMVKVNKDPEICEEATLTKKNLGDLQANEKGMVQPENVVKDPTTEEKGATENAENQEIVAPQHSEKDVQSDNKIENSDKDIPPEKIVVDTRDDKETLNILKPKYKIPNLSKKDQSNSREKKLSGNKNLEAVDHVPNRRSTRKNCAVEANERKNYNAKVATVKGMVEGDLELSDESSDNIDLLKRVMKEISEQSTCESSKTDVENNFLNKDGVKGAIHSTKEKTVKGNDFAQLSVEEKTKAESSDASKKRNCKNKPTKEKEVLKKPEIDKTLSLKTKVKETIVSKEIKTKFCDLFGDSSSLITPEDLGLTAQEVRIESSSSNYFPIFEDAQDAVDLGDKISSQTEKDLPIISVEKPPIGKIESSKNRNQEPRIEKGKDITKEKTKSCKSKDTEGDKTKVSDSEETELKLYGVKLIDTNEVKTKSCKNIQKECISKDADELNTNPRKKIEKQQLKMDLDKIKPKSTSSKNAEKEQHNAGISDTNEIKCKIKRPKIIPKEIYADTKIDLNGTKAKSSAIPESEQHDGENQTKSLTSKNVEQFEATAKVIDVKTRKSRKNEDKSVVTIETEEIPQPAVITIDSKIPLTADKTDSVNFVTEEPGVVKTVVISTGVQQIQEMPVNVISPILIEPVMPNICIQEPIPISNSVHIQALATSTPAKQIVQNVQETSCRSPDVSNTSNDQSASINADSQNMEAPDVRIFVKRRRRVVKKTTPSKN